jgi:hypothetical protein
MNSTTRFAALAVRSVRGATGVAGGRAVAGAVSFPLPSSASFSTIIDLYEQKEKAEENFYIKRMEKEQKEIKKIEQEMKEKKKRVEAQREREERT